MDDDINSGVRALLIDLIDQIIQRPLSKVIIEDEQNNPFITLKNELESNSSMTLNQFHSPIQDFFSNAKSQDVKYVPEAATILEDFFEKKFKFICSIGNYCFKDILLDAAKKTFPNIESLSQNTEDNQSNKEDQSIRINHRGKKSTKTVRIFQNDHHYPNVNDDYTDKNDESFDD